MQEQYCRLSCALPRVQHMQTTLNMLLTLLLCVCLSTRIVLMRLTMSSILPSVPCMSGSSLRGCCVTPRGNRRWLSLVPENPTTICAREYAHTQGKPGHTYSRLGCQVAGAF